MLQSFSKGRLEIRCEDGGEDEEVFMQGVQNMRSKSDEITVATRSCPKQQDREVTQGESRNSSV